MLCPRHVDLIFPVTDTASKAEMTYTDVIVLEETSRAPSRQTYDVSYSDTDVFFNLQSYASPINNQA